jgi:hypothetical protein
LNKGCKGKDSNEYWVHSIQNDDARGRVKVAAIWWIKVFYCVILKDINKP